MGLDGCFASMKEWLIETVKHVVDREDVALIVRAHPAEAWLEGGDTVAGLLSAAGIGLPENVRVYQGSDPVNTYALIELCDAELVYNSTTGMELPLLKKPVLVAGRPHYAMRGFTRDAVKREEYWRILDALIRGRPQVKTR